jgi:hypothetical protein
MFPIISALGVLWMLFSVVCLFDSGSEYQTQGLVHAGQLSTIEQYLQPLK